MDCQYAWKKVLSPDFSTPFAYVFYPIKNSKDAKEGNLSVDEVGVKAIDKKTLIIGNGDIKSREEALQRIKETGCDGVMVARGAFGNPWLFRLDNYQPALTERLTVMLEHAQLYEKLFSGKKNFVTMRKNFKAYANGFEGAHELRAKLMETQNAEEVKDITSSFLG